MRLYRMRALFVAVCLQAVIACEGHSPIAPRAFDAEMSRSSQSSGITASPVSWSEIIISWKSGSGNVNGFEVSRSATGVNGPYAVVGFTAGTATGYADAGLSPATEYCYEIRSSRTAGGKTTYSDYSNAACATTLASPVNAPTETKAMPAGSESSGRATVRVTWSDNSSNEDGFRVESASVPAGPWSLAGTTAANATSLSDSYAAPEKQICFRVIAFAGGAPSLAAAPDCTTPPAVPTLLSETAADQQSITVTWTDNSAVEDGYTVSRQVSGSAWTDIATLPASTTSYRDAGATTDVSYTYRVYAAKDGGYSGYSNEAVGVIATIRPAAPLDASAAFTPDDYVYGKSYFEMFWRDESANEAGFRIEYSSDGTSAWVTFATVAANVTAFGATLDQFNFASYPANGCYRVVAYNASGDSDPSNIACAEWGVPPTDLVATAVDQQSIDLAWHDNAQFEAGFLVYRSTTQYGEHVHVASLPANSTRFHDTALGSGQEYWYYVAVDYGNGNMDYSDLATATTSAAPTSSQSLSAGPSRRVSPPRAKPPAPESAHSSPSGRSERFWEKAKARKRPE